MSFRIGKNKKENWRLLDESSPTDIFFHLRSFPSGYVILVLDGKPDAEQIREGGELCKNNTKYRHMKNVYVDYTPCSNVVKGERVGEVMYISNRKVNKIMI